MRAIGTAAAGTGTCMLPAASSFCLEPAQIWYSAVENTAPPPTAQPSQLEPICVSVTVDRPTPRHTTTIAATTFLLACLPKSANSAASTCAHATLSTSQGGV